MSQVAESVARNERIQGFINYLTALNGSLCLSALHAGRSAAKKLQKILETPQLLTTVFASHDSPPGWEQCPGTVLHSLALLLMHPDWPDFAAVNGTLMIEEIAAAVAGLPRGGADVPDIEGFPPLVRAAAWRPRLGSYRRRQQLLRRPIRRNEALSWVLRCKADIDAVDTKKQRSALGWAAAVGHHDTVCWLLEQGARRRKYDASGLSPLDFVCSRCYRAHGEGLSSSSSWDSSEEDDEGAPEGDLLYFILFQPPPVFLCLPPKHRALLLGRDRTSSSCATGRY